jgi:pre-mRNA-processing factor 17
VLCPRTVCSIKVQGFKLTSDAEKWLAMQSLDNQILIYSAETYKQNRKKGYRGHTVAGYACVPAFSPDGRFISSGDGAGNVHFWDFKTGRKYPNKLEAHQRVCIDQKWLPHETVGRPRGDQRRV